jgi:amino acid transporter
VPGDTPTASGWNVLVITPEKLEPTSAMPPVGAMPRVGATAPAAGEGSRLHRKLSSFGVLLLTLSCLSPVFSIYGVGSDVLLHAGTGAAAAFICGIGVAIVWAVVYAELGSAYPYAGGDYVGVGSILGAWAGFASLTAWAVTLAPTIAFLAKTITVYVGDLVPAASSPSVRSPPRSRSHCSQYAPAPS